MPALPPFPAREEARQRLRICGRTFGGSVCPKLGKEPVLLWWRLAGFFFVPTETDVFKAFLGRWEVPSESSFSQGRAGKAREPCRVQTPPGGGIDSHDWAFGRDILARVRKPPSRIWQGRAYKGPPVRIKRLPRDGEMLNLPAVPPGIGRGARKIPHRPRRLLFDGRRWQIDAAIIYNCSAQRMVSQAPFSHEMCCWRGGTYAHHQRRDVVPLILYASVS